MSKASTHHNYEKGQIGKIQEDLTLFSKDRTEIVQYCIERCQQYIEQGQMEYALLSLWKAMSFLEFIQEDHLKLQTLDLCMQLATYLPQFDEIQFLIEANLALESESNNELVSSSYFILSMIYLQKNELNHAYSFAKLAYFYALKLPENKQDNYLCNAQLQLTFVALLTNRSTKATYFIDKFNWHLENCKNNQERALVSTIHFINNIVNGHFDMVTFHKIKGIFCESKLHFLPLYLAYVIDTITKKFGQQAETGETEQMLKIILERRNLHAMIDLSKYAKFIHRCGYHSELFFERAELLYRDAKCSNSNVRLINFMVKNEFEPFLKNLFYTEKDVQSVFHWYFNESFGIVFDMKDNEFFEGIFTKYEGVYEILSDIEGSEKHIRFFDLHNLQTFEQFV